MRWVSAGIALALAAALPACSTLPDIQHKSYDFPENAYTGEPDRKYKSLGLVRSKVEYTTLDPNAEETKLCENYFNRAVQKLVKYARDAGGDAVIDVKSVVFTIDNQAELHSSPECVDDGGEGQVLARGIAVKWLDDEVEVKEPRPEAEGDPEGGAAAKAASKTPKKTPKK